MNAPGAPPDNRPGRPPAACAVARPAAGPVGGPDIRAPIRLGLAALLLLLFGFLGWAIFVPIHGAVIAHGRLDVEKSRQVVQDVDGGKIAEILVQEGDSVRQGDILVRLDRGLEREALKSSEAQLARLMAESARYEAERDGLAAMSRPPALDALIRRRPDLAEAADEALQLFRSGRRGFLDEVAGMRQQRRHALAQGLGLEAEEAAALRQRGLLGDERARTATLVAKGLARQSTLDETDREIARLEGLSGSIQAEIAAARARADQADLEVVRLTSGRRDQAEAALRQTTAARTALEERIALLRTRIAAADVRAPAAGRVLALRFTSPSAVVRPAEPILYILPDDRPLIVVAEVAPSDITAVRAGQRAAIRLRQPATTDRGDREGHVALVSADALADQGTAPAFYRVEIAFAGTGGGPADDLVANAPLMAGMPVEVFLETGARPALWLLTEPLTGYFRRAFRSG